MFREFGEPKRIQEKPERTSGLMKVAGVSPEEEAEILKEKADVFEDQKMLKAEREKTSQEREIVLQILSFLPEFVKQYGGESVPLRPEHVHVFEYKDIPEENKKELGSIRGHYNNEIQGAWVVIDREEENNLTFAQRLAHELIHFYAFQCADVPDKETKKISEANRIEGFLIKIRDEKGEEQLYFNDWNEAMTEELTIKFDEEYFKSISTLANDLVHREEARTYRAESHPKLTRKQIVRDIANITTIQLKDTMQSKPGASPGMWRSTIEGYKFEEARFTCAKIMGDIADKYPDKFTSMEEVFEIFARAYFTGRMLPVARLIEQTYGRGSFRRMGAESKAKKRR